MSLTEIGTKQEAIVPNQLVTPMKNIRSSGIFEPDYLDNLKIVTFGMESEWSDDGHNIRDFIYGKTTDFVGIHNKDDYDKINPKDADDRHAIAFYFLRGMPTYDEFITHEIAHNIYDLEYKKNFGGYIEKNGIPAVSDEYSNKMREKFSSIILDSYPNLETDKFEFSRQQICEVFTFLYEREFRNRKNTDKETNSKVKKNCQTFINNPEEELTKFNFENNRNCTIEDFYSENHILSIIVAPLIEEKYVNFNDRLALF